MVKTVVEADWKLVYYKNKGVALFHSFLVLTVIRI
jgi:hypothetical protein